MGAVKRKASKQAILDDESEEEDDSPVVEEVPASKQKGSQKGRKSKKTEKPVTKKARGSQVVDSDDDIEIGTAFLIVSPSLGVIAIFCALPRGALAMTRDHLYMRCFLKSGRSVVSCQILWSPSPLNLNTPFPTENSCYDWTESTPSQGYCAGFSQFVYSLSVICKSDRCGIARRHWCGRSIAA